MARQKSKARKENKTDILESAGPSSSTDNEEGKGRTRKKRDASGQQVPKISKDNATKRSSRGGNLH